MFRNDGDEERALSNLAPNVLVPRIPAPKLALVEPNLNAGRSKRLTNAARGVRVLRGVAQENCFAGSIIILVLRVERQDIRIRTVAVEPVESLLIVDVGAPASGAHFRRGGGQSACAAGGGYVWPPASVGS